MFDAVAGVQPQSETVWRQASRYEVPRIAFINKYDRIGANYFHAIDTMRDRLGAHAVAAQVPMGEEDHFWGVIDLVTMTAWDFKADDKGMTYPEPMDAIPDEFVDIVEERRAELLEAAADYDDELMELVLMDEKIPVDLLKKALRAGVLANDLNLVFVGSAYKNKGVQELLDAVVDYLPSPLDVPPVTGINPDTDQEEERKPSNKEPFSSLAFKIMTDPYVGKLTYLRVYSGRLDSGSYVVNANNGKKERIGRILEMHSNEQHDVDYCSTGDIVAAVGLKNTTTGESLCDEDHPIILESMDFPDPVIDIAVEPKTKAEQDLSLIHISGTQLTMRTFHSGVGAGEDITQGLPRVTELFEARKPKGLAILAEISGTLQISATKDSRTLTIHNEDGEVREYQTGARAQLMPGVSDMCTVEVGQQLTKGSIDPHELLRLTDVNTTLRYIVDQVQDVYTSQGVDINDKHVEVIARQMLRKVTVTDPGSSRFLPGAQVNRYEFEEEVDRIMLEGGDVPTARPLILGITKASLATDSFLSAASFQETTKVLTDAAIEGKVDKLQGLKENVIIGKPIPAGTGLKLSLIHI